MRELIANIPTLQHAAVGCVWSTTCVCRPVLAVAMARKVLQNTKPTYGGLAPLDRSMISHFLTQAPVQRSRPNCLKCIIAAVFVLLVVSARAVTETTRSGSTHSQGLSTVNTRASRCNRSSRWHLGHPFGVLSSLLGPYSQRKPGDSRSIKQTCFLGRKFFAESEVLSHKSQKKVTKVTKSTSDFTNRLLIIG